MHHDPTQLAPAGPEALVDGQLPMTSSVRSFGNCSAGNVTLLSALVGTAIMGGIGVGMDVANAVRVMREIQQAADAAALAGRTLQSGDEAQRITEAHQVFLASLSRTHPTEPFQVAVSVERLPSAVAAERYRVTVDVSYDFPTRFGSLVGYGYHPVKARAVAEPVDVSPISGRGQDGNKSAENLNAALVSEHSGVG